MNTSNSYLSPAVAVKAYSFLPPVVLMEPVRGCPHEMGVWAKRVEERKGIATEIMTPVMNHSFVVGFHFVQPNRHNYKLICRPYFIKSWLFEVITKNQISSHKHRPQDLPLRASPRSLSV